MIKAVPLFSGSSGNATYLSCDGEEFLIDAGVSCKRLCEALLAVGSGIERIRGIFVTHEHVDHINGLEVLSKKYNIPIYMNAKSARYFDCASGHDFTKRSLRIMDAADKIRTENAEFEAFRTPHDSWGSVCYRVVTADDCFGLATDIGFVTKSVAAALIGCRNVVIESNHDIEMLKNGPYPIGLQDRILSKSGHLSNLECARFVPYLAEAGTEKIFLAHLSKENNTPDLAFAASRSALDESGHADVLLEVCKP